MSFFPFPPFDFVIFPLMMVVFSLLLWIQWKRPLRHQRLNSVKRVARNVGVSIPMFVVFRLLMIPLPLFTALWAANHDIGLLRWLLPDADLGMGARAGLGFLLFDYSYYWWHQATHYWPLFFLPLSHSVPYRYGHGRINGDTVSLHRYDYRVGVPGAGGAGVWH